MIIFLLINYSLSGLLRVLSGQRIGACVCQKRASAAPPPPLFPPCTGAYRCCLGDAGWLPIGKEAGKWKMSITVEDM